MHVDADQLRLGSDPDPDAAPRARRYARERLRGTSLEHLADDAAMVVTELVTNALLHARPPLTVRVDPGPDHVRVSVEDSSRAQPLLAVARSDAATGRGLALVGALSRAWGAEPTPGGKVVWCEIAGGGDEPEGAGEPPAAFDDVALAAAAADRPGAQMVTVDLGDVPTSLLLEAKAQVDNLSRELTLMSAGAASGLGRPVPRALARLIETVVTEFAEVRRALKEQSLNAARLGHERTHLRLRLDTAAAAAGRAYLTALDEADAYARAGHLLTLETPPQHRVFRAWYVESLIEQLDAARRGLPAPARQTFEARLLEELGTLTTAQRASDRAARLQRVTAALAAARTDSEVAQVVVDEGMSALGASAGILLTPEPGTNRLVVQSAVGYLDHPEDERRTATVGDQLPGAQALRSGEPVWLATRAERDERFPRMIGLDPDVVSLCAVPLVVGGRALGVLRLDFQEPRLFDEDERAFVVALAAQTAHALERSSLYVAEQRARAAAERLARRLERLSAVTGDLAGARDVAEVAEIVVNQIADALGSSITSLAVLDGDMLRTVRLRGARTEVAKRYSSYPVSADLPASEAVRTGRTVIVRDNADLVRRYPSVAGQPSAERSYACLPLLIGGEVLGVVSLGFPSVYPVEDPAEQRFLEAMADTCAQALDRALAVSRAAESAEKLAFLAEASAVLAENRDYRGTLATIADLVVPRLADWCGVTLVQDGQLVNVAVAHKDPERVAWAKELNERYPIDPDAPLGAPAVVRTGVSELYEEITPDMLALAARDEEHLRLMLELQLSSAMTVPLTGRSGTVGTLDLVYGESGRRYSPEDLPLVEDLARRAAAAVETARQIETQTARLASISRVAEAAQLAILAPVPSRIRRLRLGAAYVSASRDALVGGDLYEVIDRPHGMRLLIGDVRGKGLDAVRLATVVLGLFRSSGVDHEDLTEVARQIDRRLMPFLAEEDFVTALLVDVADDGRVTVVCCGHPAPLLSRAGVVRQLECEPTVPLGLGVEPTRTETMLQGGDRLLLFTDGLMEARTATDGQFVDLMEVSRPLVDEELPRVLSGILAKVQAASGERLGDDLAMLLVEYAAD